MLSLKQSTAPPPGLGTFLFLKTPKVKRPGKQTGINREPLDTWSLELGVWGVKVLKEETGAAGSPLQPPQLFPIPYLAR